jgi:hypothetical protein
VLRMSRTSDTNAAAWARLLVRDVDAWLPDEDWVADLPAAVYAPPDQRDEAYDWLRSQGVSFRADGICHDPHQYSHRFPWGTREGVALARGWVARLYRDEAVVAYAWHRRTTPYDVLQAIAAAQRPREDLSDGMGEAPGPLALHRVDQTAHPGARIRAVVVGQAS